MTKYRLHDGIVYTSVRNVYLLVATRSAWDQFPSVKTLSPLQGWFCAGIEKGLDTEEIIQLISKQRKIKEQAVRSRMDVFLNKMIQENYLIPENDCGE